MGIRPLLGNEAASFWAPTGFSALQSCPHISAPQKIFLSLPALQLAFRGEFLFYGISEYFGEII